MAIPTNDFIEAPYEDDKLKYDYEFHRYILKSDFASYQTGLNLLELWESEENLEWYLEYVSRVVHTYITQFKAPKYRKRLEYYLSHSKTMRTALKEVMIDAITYNFEDGGFLIAYQTGVNLKEMKELPMRIDMAVSIVGEKIAKNYKLEDRYFDIEFEIEHDTYGTEW